MAEHDLDLFMRDPTESAIAAQARSTGMSTLRASALTKAFRGETTFEEVIRVTHSDSSGGHACPTCERRCCAVPPRARSSGRSGRWWAPARTALPS